MAKKGLDLTRNPLSRRKEIFIQPKKQKALIEKYGELKNITKLVMDKINIEDRTFVNRLDSAEEIKSTENFEGLKESISKIGLMNTIYLVENKDKYTIVSGFRRSLALQDLFIENSNLIFNDKAIVLNSEAPIEFLEQLSIDENTKRKDLTILEQAYKFDKYSNQEGITIDDCLAKFNIGKTQFHAIKKAINFEPEVKEILDEIGAKKADLINKIVLLESEINESKTIQELVDWYKGHNMKELEGSLYKFKLGKKANKKTYEIKRTKKKTSIVINKEIDDKTYRKIMKIIENIEE